MTVRSIFFAAAALFICGMRFVDAHEDSRLLEVLANDPVTRQQYHLGSLAGQLAHLSSQLDDKDLAATLLDRVRDTRRGVRHAYVSQVIAGDTANEIAAVDLEQALALLNTIEDTEAWVKTAWKLARKAGKDKNADVTNKLLNECVARARMVDDLELRAELISGTGANYRYSNTEKGAPLVYESYGLAQAIRDPFDRAIMMNEVGAHLMDIGDRSLAIAVFDSVSELANTIDDPLQRAKVLVMLGGEQAEKGLPDRAAEALERGIAIALTAPDTDEKTAVISEFARNLGQCQRFSRGIEVARAIDDPYHRAEGLIRIAKNLKRAKREPEGLELLSEIEQLTTDISDPYSKGVALRKLAAEYLELEQKEKVRSILKSALDCMNRLGDPLALAPHNR